MFNRHSPVLPVKACHRIKPLNRPISWTRQISKRGVCSSSRGKCFHQIACYLFIKHAVAIMLSFHGVDWWLLLMMLLIDDVFVRRFTCWHSSFKNKFFTPFVIETYLFACWSTSLCLPRYVITEIRKFQHGGSNIFKHHDQFACAIGSILICECQCRFRDCDLKATVNTCPQEFLNMRRL